MVYCIALTADVALTGLPCDACVIFVFMPFHRQTLPLNCYTYSAHLFGAGECTESQQMAQRLTKILHSWWS